MKIKTFRNSREFKTDSGKAFRMEYVNSSIEKTEGPGYNQPNLELVHCFCLDIHDNPETKKLFSLDLKFNRGNLYVPAGMKRIDLSTDELQFRINEFVELIAREFGLHIHEHNFGPAKNHQITGEIAKGKVSLQFREHDQ